MSIQFHSEDVDFKLNNQSLVADWIAKCITQRGKNLLLINYIFCSDEYLLEVNRKHLNHDYYTDIITFDNSFDENEVLADIFISIDRVRDNAAELNLMFNDELNRVIIHGVLHLLGWEDSSAELKEKMRLEEDKCLEIIKL